MIAQYRKIKAEHSEYLLFYRMGDFYELFFEDAILGADLLSITLTKRGSANGLPIPMAGIPHHSSKSYFQKLVDKNITFAICEQIGTVNKHAKTPIEREVTKIITPGTVLDEDFMQDTKTHALISLFLSGKTFGIGYLNLSQNKIEFTECTNIEDIKRLITLYDPSEILIAEKQKEHFKSLHNLTIRPDWDFYQQANYKKLCEHFNVSNLNALSIENKPVIVSVIGSILKYISFTKQDNIHKINNISEIVDHNEIKLDQATLNHMIFGTNKNDTSSLYHFLNHTKTPMGERLLRTWCGKPTLNHNELYDRQKIIQQLIKNNSVLSFQNLLKGCHDLERCSARLQKKSIKPNELLKLSNSLKKLPELHQSLSSMHSLEYLRIIPLNELVDIIDKTIFNYLESENTDQKHYIINDGINDELDKFRQLSAHSTFIATFEKQEQARINNFKIKIGYNKLQGYFIEIPKSQNVVVPENYIRRQTLKSAERYITAELEAFEKTIITNQTKAKALEQKLYEHFIDSLQCYVTNLIQLSDAISKLDVLQSMAYCAKDHWVQPEFCDSSSIIDIRKGFHPIVAKSLDQGFIANDTYLDSEQCLSIITGPNMGGKSTYMRQTALIVVLAYMGSMVPAKHCRLGKVDQIFTRIGANDDITKGQSTFMVEMQETAFIMRNATNQSLIIMDEIGRGTSTFDGLSIAYACASQIANKIKSLCLFATHYFELTQLDSQYPSISNWHVSAKEDQDELIFLHKVLKGAANKSYGIAVAQLAGIPADTILSAKEKLHQLEMKKNQLSTPSLSTNFIISEIQSIDINNLSPKEAWDYLSKLKELIDETVI